MLTVSITAPILKCTVPIDFQHIGGHQDDDIPFHRLDRMAQLNIWMDGEVKRYLWYLISLPSAPPKPSTIHKEGWSCWVCGVKAMTDPSKLIKRGCMAWNYKNGYMTVGAFIGTGSTVWIVRQMGMP